MKFTLGWLKEHLETDADLTKILETLTAIGLEVEGIENPGEALADFRIAKVVSAEKHPNADKLQLLKVDTGSGDPVYLLGEVYGQGVQDLHYGMDKPGFRLFDVYVGHPTQGRYMDVEEKVELSEKLGLEMVPNLYEGPFDWDKMTELRDGRDYSDSNMKEGIVILPMKERRDDNIGRVQLKFVSPKYLMRKNGTELA